MWFNIRQASRGRRGALFVLVSPRGDVVPWYANNVRAMLPYAKAESLCSEYNRRALALPPMWASYTGARWEWALREIYGLRVGADGLERWHVVGVERTAIKRAMVRRSDKERQTIKAVKDYLKFTREARQVVGGNSKVSVKIDGMQFFDTGNNSE